MYFCFGRTFFGHIEIPGRHGVCMCIARSLFSLYSRYCASSLISQQSTNFGNLGWWALIRCFHIKQFSCVPDPINYGSRAPQELSRLSGAKATAGPAHRVTQCAGHSSTTFDHTAPAENAWMLCLVQMSATTEPHSRPHTPAPKLVSPPRSRASILICDFYFPGLKLTYSF